MATVTRTTCDICGTLLLPTEDDMPWSMATSFNSVRVHFLCDDKAAKWDICPRCQRRMFRYLKKHGSEFDKAGDPDV